MKDNTQNFFFQMHVHAETKYKLEIISNALEDMAYWAPTIIEADKIVGAQFYYSNPILYLIGEDIDVANAACLYRNIYLININEMDTGQFYDSIAGINAVFLEKIGQYAEVASQISNNFPSYHATYGLYLVGIDIGNLKEGIQC